MTVKRPLVRYHGGKWRLAPWIIEHFPAHRIYVEPYGGGGSVLLRKPVTYAEVYNDLDGEIVNLFTVVRDNGAELKRLLELTPFSRVEFESAWRPCESTIEQARRTLIRAFMGFGSSAVTMAREAAKTGRPGTGFRSNSNRSGTTPAHDWRNYPENIPLVVDRLRGVCIENKSALDVMRQQDSAATLHYVDPPYMSETRDAGSDYVFEMSEDQHIEMLFFLRDLKGAVVLSGYPCPLYDMILTGWQRVEKASLADGARKRTEVLWIKP